MSLNLKSPNEGVSTPRSIFIIMTFIMIAIVLTACIASTTSERILAESTHCSDEDIFGANNGIAHS